MEKEMASMGSQMKMLINSAEQMKEEDERRRLAEEEKKNAEKQKADQDHANYGGDDGLFGELLDLGNDERLNRIIV